LETTGASYHIFIIGFEGRDNLSKMVSHMRRFPDNVVEKGILWDEILLFKT